jgi:hypothetical protein
VRIGSSEEPPSHARLVDRRRVLRLVVGDHAGRIGYSSAAWLRVGDRWSRCHLRRGGAGYPVVVAGPTTPRTTGRSGAHQQHRSCCRSTTCRGVRVIQFGRTECPSDERCRLPDLVQRHDGCGGCQRCRRRIGRLAATSFSRPLGLRGSATRKPVAAHHSNAAVTYAEEVPDFW